MNESPPNPADWICGAVLADLVTDPPDTSWMPLQRQEAPTTWEALRPALRRFEAMRQRTTATV